VTSRPTRRGGGRAEGSAPSSRSWQARLDDPHEPLYTVGVAAELLDTDPQALRRLEVASDQISARPSGNQRRYSRRDIEVLAAAMELARDGVPPAAIARVLELERRVEVHEDR
jgi:MerR family transcriptional regulator, heat shock protein HspR